MDVKSPWGYNPVEIRCWWYSNRFVEMNSEVFELITIQEAAMFGPMVAMAEESAVFFHSPTKEEFTMNVLKVIPLILEPRGVPLRLITTGTGKEASVSQRTYHVVLTSLNAKIITGGNNASTTSSGVTGMRSALTNQTR